MRPLNLPLETMGLSRFLRLKRYLFSFLRHSSLRKLLNLLSIEFQMFVKSKRVSGMPYILKIENTNICNLHCPLCYENRKAHNFEGSRGFGRMKLEEFRKIVNELHPWVYRINLYGFGEPFLFNEIFEMIRIAADHNISVAITSNFNTVNSKRINKIIESGLEHLIVSVDGIDQESYERYQIGGHFERVINNIRQLLETKDNRKAKYPFVDLQFLIMKHNVHLLDRATQLARDLNIGIRFSRIGVDLTNDKECEEWLPDIEMRKNLNFEDQIILKQKSLPLCMWLYRTAFINWDLGVSPCCNYYTGEKMYDFGSMRYQSFSEIWNGKRYLEARSIFKDGKSDYIDTNICCRCVDKRKKLRECLR